MLQLLPFELIEEVLLNLSSRDVAAAVLALPSLADVISSKSFIRRHRDRFANIRGYLPLDVVKRHFENEPVSKYDICRASWSKTVSNHCVACLLDPLLLTRPLSVSKCFCIDHLSLYLGNTQQVLWGEVSWWNRDMSGGEWPVCWGFKCRESEITKCKLENEVSGVVKNRP